MSTEKNNTFKIDENRPTDWFEPLYANSATDGKGIPWANMKTHPSFAGWLEKNNLDGAGKSALVVGCGMGDDAIELESRGFEVTAFDVSNTAIEYCKDRFATSNVNFVQADLLKKQPNWERKFDYVLEIFTIQALPPKYEDDLIKNIAKFVSYNGTLMVISAVGNKKRAIENGPPWLLTSDHIDKFISCGLFVVETHIEKSFSNNEDYDTYITTFKNNML
jgi:2-polyprenyl-3-methyl-5-hydroxy-6-metoxy-1,4-benzoquinol methylase